MRISDWSSDVCSSDLRSCLRSQHGLRTIVRRRRMANCARVGCRFQASDDGVDHRAGLARVAQDRKSVVSGKRVSVRVDLGGRRILKKTNREIVCYDRYSASKSTKVKKNTKKDT